MINTHQTLPLFDLNEYELCFQYACHFSYEYPEVREAIQFKELNARQIQEVHHKLASKYRAAAAEPWKPVNLEGFSKPERMFAEMVRMSVDPVLVPRPEGIQYSRRGFEQ